jgi:Undecaprenyl-phosphate galactose phosphotransferase WbaP
VAAFALTDLGVLVLCMVLVSLLGSPWSPRAFLSSFARLFPNAAFFLAAFAFSGLYPGLCPAPGAELRRYTLASLMACVAGLVINTRLLGMFDGDEFDYLVLWLISAPLLTGMRVVSRSFAARTRRWGVPVVVLGAGREAKALIDRLLLCPWIGYKPALVISDASENGAAYRGISVIHGLSRGVRVAVRRRFSTVLVAVPATERARLRAALQACSSCFPHFLFFGEFLDQAGISTQVLDFEGIFALHTVQRLSRTLPAVLKRTIEVAGVVIGGLACMPFLLPLALAIRLDSPGPIFYRQRRLGRGGQEFHALKFRSMVPDADKRLAACLEDPRACREWTQSHKIKNDPRITRVGRFLRKTSLDELPQLWNVLKGEMSMVGPRPIVKAEVARYGEAWAQVSQVRPGMSGLWQVSGRSDRGYGERVELDRYYIRNWSIWLDAWIMAKTLWIVVAGKGAY